ncbi:MAG: PIN domain-containing protein [Opitutaceae bacterium]|nr:PIN domain-containing protein [Opitutaceae bacterium]
MSAIVLDTNVLVAGLVSRRGAAASLVDALFRDELRVAYTSATLCEYADVLDRPEFVDTILPSDRMGVIVKLRTSGMLVDPAAVPSADWPDADDLPFVAATLATGRKILVTLNRRDFAPAVALGVRVLSPSEARRELLP